MGESEFRVLMLKELSLLRAEVTNLNAVLTALIERQLRSSAPPPAETPENGSGGWKVGGRRA